MSAEHKDLDTQDGSGGILAKAPPSVAKVCYEHEGIIMPFFMTRKCIEQLINFKLRPDDVFIITYPKTGTTWATQIMLLVKYEGDLSQFEGQFIMKMVPFLETVDNTEIIGKKPENVKDIDSMRTNCEVADAMPTDSPRILKTHIDPKWLPKALRDDPTAKVVYVARNPKDTAVSYFHFCQYIKELPDYASWDEFLEEFINDRVPEGSWFDNTLYWWKLRNHPNVLYLTYEDMKQDSRKAVVQIAEFMGKSFADDIIDRIVEASSFKTMKNSPSSNPDLAFKGAVNTSGKKSFMRKGATGDWTNYFTVEQNRRFDALYEERMAGSGLELRFE